MASTQISDRAYGSVSASAAGPFSIALNTNSETDPRLRHLWLSLGDVRFHVLIAPEDRDAIVQSLRQVADDLEAISDAEALPEAASA